MSPHLRSLLDDAADDGGRPVRYDLEAVRAAGRRSIRRRRAVTAGGGLGAAAVITSVALLLAPGTAPAGPADGVDVSGPVDEISSEAIEQEPQLVLATVLYSALLDRGYELGSEGYSSGVEAAGVDGAPAGATMTSISVTRDGGTGAAVVAEFSGGLRILSGLGEVPDDGVPAPEMLCAVAPVRVIDGFAWEPCSTTAASDGSTLLVATGGDSDADAIGATFLRADGTGVSVSLSTAPYERAGNVGVVLPALPLTADELGAVVTEMASQQRLEQLTDEELAATPTGPPPAPPGSGEMCATALPPDDQPADQGCSVNSINDASVVADLSPFIDAMAAVGFAVESIGSTGDGASSDESTGAAQSSLFRISNGDGLAGSAAIGTAIDLTSAPLMNDTSVAWCAVTPTYDRDFAWTLAADPSVACDQEAHDWTQPLLVVRRDDAIGATLVRPDGTVLSVSISTSAPMGPGESSLVQLDSLPLDVAGVRDLLLALDRANG